MSATCRAALLLACCVWVIHAQAQSSHSAGNQENSNQANIHANESTHSLANTKVKQQQPELQQRNSLWDEPIRFSSKAKDACTMVISSQGDFTKLRVSCKNKGKSYWCDFMGKPNLCRPYNKNPRHYFNQVMWELRKFQNPCQGFRVFKPQMCRLAGDESQMVFHTSWPKTSTPEPAPALQDRSQNQLKTPAAAPKVLSKPAKPAIKPLQPRKPTKTTTPKPTPEAETQVNKLAEEYCWSGLQNICAYFIGWFQN
ncbi:fibroblast growth factor-binding protein 2b [Salminus brasiliensis]|uniref:fibroblast growth factor-binding protein 2b n=1 Tax=Salminus brasiliensis TaxID=930266 RepID=UPI003B8306D2